jgi:hypothetical protein
MLERVKAERSKYEQGERFEDKTAEVLRLMGFSTEQNVLVGGRQTDILAHKQDMLDETVFVVECKDHQDPAGVDVLDGLYGRVAAYGSGAKGLLVSRVGFTAPVREQAAKLNIRLKTLEELQRGLIDLGPYLERLIHDYEGQPIEQLYVEPEVWPEGEKANRALKEYVEQWLKNPEAVHLTLGAFQGGGSEAGGHAGVSVPAAGGAVRGAVRRVR